MASQLHRRHHNRLWVQVDIQCNQKYGTGLGHSVEKQFLVPTSTIASLSKVPEKPMYNRDFMQVQFGFSLVLILSVFLRGNLLTTNIISITRQQVQRCLSHFVFFSLTYHCGFVTFQRPTCGQKKANAGFPAPQTSIQCYSSYTVISKMNKATPVKNALRDISCSIPTIKLDNKV